MNIKLTALPILLFLTACGQQEEVTTTTVENEAPVPSAAPPQQAAQEAWLLWKFELSLLE